jgi:hypothetical protein
VTFNHGVEGSSPSALTIEINNLVEYQTLSKSSCVCDVSTNRLPPPWLFPCGRPGALYLRCEPGGLLCSVFTTRKHPLARDNHELPVAICENGRSSFKDAGFAANAFAEAFGEATLRTKLE